MEEIKNRKKRLIWVAEIVFWLLVFVIFGVSIMIINYYHKNTANTYHLFLQDIDGLIVGSPVKIMGIPIGYVTQTEIINDVVYVKFIISNKDIKIPKGSMVNVESTGLGGSKSLELYPPKEDIKNLNGEYLIVKKTTRLKDALSLLDTIFKKIVDIGYRFTYFAKEFDYIEKAVENEPPDIKEKLNELNEGIDSAFEKRVRMKNKMKGIINE